VRRALLIAAVVLLASVRLAALNAADATDEENIRGTWLLVSKTQKNVETKTDPAADDPPLEVTFEEQTWRTMIGPKGAQVELRGTYFLDSKQTPKLLDLTLSSNGSSNDLFAIYKFEKNQLFVRLREMNGQRPADFATPAEDCLTLVFTRKSS
jgi:uncharacterized protein (TIGR03067 family)